MNQDQGKLLRAAKEELGVTFGKLAASLGVALPTLNGWLAPKASDRNREMPETARLLLDRILKEHRAKK